MPRIPRSMWWALALWLGLALLLNTDRLGNWPWPVLLWPVWSSAVLAPLPCMWVMRQGWRDWRAAAAVGNAEAPTRRAQLWWRAACACAMLSGLALSLGWLWLAVRLWPVMIVQ